MALAICGGRIVDPGQGMDRVGDLLIDGGCIVRIGAPGTLAAEEVLSAEGMVVCPGFIDLHCHLREPGYETKETIATGTEAAARGGFTTIVAMANTNPPVDSRSVVEYIREKCRDQGRVRVFTVGCITKGLKGEELAEMGELAEAGVVGFSDDGYPVGSSRLMRHALDYSRMFALPLINHAEDPYLAKGGVINEGSVSVRLGLKGIPAAAEEIMVGRDISLVEFTGGRLHVPHVSTAGSVELIRRARKRGLPVTAEVTPHHLTMTEEWVMGIRRLPGRTGDVRPPYDVFTKVNPPLRTPGDVQSLLEGLRDGTIDAIATDHAPHTLADKICEYDEAASGISGLETALGLLLTLVHSGQLEMGLLIQKLTSGPAAVLGSSVQGSRLTGDRGFTPTVALPSGTLAPGAPADIAIFDPQEEWVVDPDRFVSKGKNTPLAGLTLKGRVVATIYNGKVVYRRG